MKIQSTWIIRTFAGLFMLLLLLTQGQPAAASPFPAEVWMSDLNGTNGFLIDGIVPGDRVGYSVYGSGDFNGDGFADLVIGAPEANIVADPPASGPKGETYVVFGNPAVFPGHLDLSWLDGENGITIVNDYPLQYGSGRRVSMADVNNDGITDILIGCDFDYYGTHRVFVVFGQAGGFTGGIISLSSLDGTNGFTIFDDEIYDGLGLGLSNAGDVNGDGIDDIIIGAPFGPYGGDPIGKSYVVFGRDTAFPAELDVTSLDGSDGFVINGINAEDHTGLCVAAAGDINGDGFGDLIIGARYAGPNGKNRAGQSYVVFGKNPFSPSLNLSDLNGANGFALNGGAAEDWSGWSVAAAGDVNGDGFGDLIVGAHGADPGGIVNAGQAYVVFGKSSGFSASLNLSGLDGANGFAINGSGVYEYLGLAVSSAGDVNGDGLNDLIIGAPSTDRPGPAGEPEYPTGRAYVVFGTKGGFPAALEVSSLDGANGFAMTGITFNSKCGYSVAAAGDVNGDGLADVILGAPVIEEPLSGGMVVGQAYVVFGRTDLASTISLIEQWAAAGTLEGIGPTQRAADRRLQTLINMLNEAQDFAEAGDLATACQILTDAYKRTDGQPHPPDFVTGEAVAALAARIQMLQTSLGCL